jgi:hypothetical protein
MQTIGLTALVVFGLGTSAMADEIAPAEYQGVWAAARDGKENFQNIISNAVNRESAACRVGRAVNAATGPACRALMQRPLFAPRRRREST